MSKRVSRRGLYEFLEPQFRRIAPGARVLTIGAGGEVNVLLTRLSLKTGFRIVSLDVDPARQPDIVGDLCEFDFGERRFDVVVISEVLEHLHLPHVAVQKIRDVLVDGGLLILTVPFMLPIHEEPRDFFRYTRFGVEFLLREFGDVRVVPRNSYFESLAVQCARVWHAKGRAARVAGAPLVPVAYVCAPFLRKLDEWVQIDAATTGYGATARKPFAKV